MTTMNIKKCTKCKKILNVCDFHKHGSATLGIRSRCKKCTNEGRRISLVDSSLITIKRYKNRRIYDTDKHAYITFDDVRDYILAGVRFKIINDSGKDITKSNLLNLLKTDTPLLFNEDIKDLIIKYHSSKPNPSKFLELINSTRGKNNETE